MTPFALWVYLSTSPLLWLTVTLVAWLAAKRIAELAGQHPLVNPVLIAVVIIALLISVTGVNYQTYFDGAQFVHFLLGGATVALGVPLWRHRQLVRRTLVPMMVALIAGSVTAAGSAVAIAAAFGAPWAVLASLAPKSVTTPVAMAISEQTGGIPSLTAALVILTGILGAIVATPIMNLIGVRDFAARGFATGLAAHGLGTARAFACHPVAGVFAGAGMGLNAVLTPILAPLVLALWH